MRGIRFEPAIGGRASVVRPRLLDRLSQRFSRPVTVVAAPAGLGKSTLLAQAVDENRLAPRGVDWWLTCHADDAMASSLIDGLCRAADIAPPDPPDPLDRPGRAVEALVEAMWHRSPVEVALLLDDVHEIPAGSPGAEILATLLEALPRNGHVVLSGRDPLPVALARLDVRGEVDRVGETELLFTAEELSEFAAQRQVPGTKLAGCAGWPALAELVANAVPGVEAAYVWEEVLSAIKPERRRDLALLAHVGPIDDTLAVAALGHETDLDGLMAELPLVGTTPGGGRSIHALWRPALAKVVEPEAIAAARRRAGAELARTGDVSAAVRLLIEADAWDDVSEVVVDAFGAARPPVPGDVVAAWLMRLPDKLQRGPLGQLLGAVGVVQTDPGTAVEQLQDAAVTYRRAGDIAGELACIAQLAQVAWWLEQPERMLGIASRVLEMEAEGHLGAVPFACFARVLLADLANESSLALAELDRIPAGSFNQTFQTLVDWLRSTSLNHLGRPDEALAAAERACAIAGPIHRPLVETARLQALWFQGKVDEAVRELPPLAERIAALGLRNYTALISASSCLALAHNGRPGDAVPFLERARSVGIAPGEVPLVDVNLATAEAALAVARGDEAGATAVLDDYLARWPLLGTGHAAAPQQRSLAFWYLLVPRSREMWDTAPLGPCFAQARDLAQAVVALRRDGRLARRSPGLLSPDVVRAHLPLPWATELALGAIAAGHQDGWTLLDGLWPAAQPEVRKHAGDPTAPLNRPARTALGRLPVPPKGQIELRLLGPVELRRDGVLVDAPEWRRERARSLLAHLVLHRSVSRERLAADLWPALDAEAQSRNLRVTLTYLLRVLEPARAERDAPFLVRSHGASLVLERGDQLSVDVWLFDDLADRATRADRDGMPSVALEPMRRAVTLWRGDPSELASEDWALTDVEERRIRVVELATRAGELLLAKDQPDEARQMGEAALRVDPWSERAHKIVVAAHTALGHDRAAQQARARYSAALDELGT